MEPCVTIIRNCQRNGGKSSTMLDGKGREVWDCPGRGCPCGAPKKEKLSPMQLRILRTMIERGVAAFTGESARIRGFGVYEAKHGIVIRAYQSPQYFLGLRGLIRRIERDGIAGYWYEITPKGRDAVASVGV